MEQFHPSATRWLSLEPVAKRKGSFIRLSKVSVYITSLSSIMKEFPNFLKGGDEQELEKELRELSSILSKKNQIEEQDDTMTSWAILLGSKRRDEKLAFTLS